ncbi:conserved hypothetical protein [Candidatus Zixiibacteriota bacterium]|nr:conserved hypothetical protein [candidate division Zixibacteria bacterium]
MKMVFLTFFEGKTDEVIELLTSEHVQSYTHWPKTHGKSAGFRPRMDTEVWPGNNAVVLFPIDDKQLDALMDNVHRFNEETEYEGISAFAFNVERMEIKKPVESKRS